MPTPNRSEGRIAMVQAAYYAASGAWPLLSYRTFEAVTGPKREPWLVKTVGLLTLAIAAAMAGDVRRGEPHRSADLGLLASMAFTAVDLWYALVRRRLGPAYLIDAAVELMIAGAWLQQLRPAGDRIGRRL